MRFKYVVTGAGFCGAIAARLIAEELNEKVLVVEKRNHIAGNAYDYYNEHGILVHKYGPHIFHTNNKEVWEYLSRFTGWRLYQHRVLAYVDGRTVPMPINIDTINRLKGTNYNSTNINDYINSVKVDKPEVLNAEDMVITQIGYELYEKLIKGYTKKQWDLYPHELSPEVTARIPVRKNRDDRYFTDKYQGMPQNGYTRMFENILDHKNICLMLNTDFAEIKEQLEYDKLIYTGCIDEFFGYKFGKLPYRSLNFEFETVDAEVYQEVGTVNYPNDYDFTRITEFKHLTGQKSHKTTILKEYPRAEGQPYYPVPNNQNRVLYEKYAKEAEKCGNVLFAGRLGSYKYLNMDRVVEETFKLFRDGKINLP